MDIKCKYCLKKQPKENMEVIRKGKVNNYYCPHCLKLLNDKNEAVELFYSYTNSLEPISQLYMSFKLMRDKGLTDSDILYTMRYVIKNKSVLNFPRGLLYYIDRAMREKRSAEQIQIQKEKALASINKIPNIIIKTVESPQNDEMDISDFL